MDYQKKLSSLKNKRVVEIGNEKKFIRTTDIAWLIEVIEKQQEEIKELKYQNNKYRRVYGYSIFGGSTRTNI